MVHKLVQKMLDDGYAVQSARHVRQVTKCVFKHLSAPGIFVETSQRPEFASRQWCAVASVTH